MSNAPGMTGVGESQDTPALQVDPALRDLSVEAERTIIQIHFFLIQVGFQIRHAPIKLSLPSI